MVLNIFLTVLAYLIGSIPSAVWIGKKFYNIDIREHGSKNAGATNMMRVLGRKAALPVFAIDFLKGFVAVKLSLFTLYPDNSPEIFYLKITLAAVAVLGHIFPIFAKFKGGKGVATIAGAAFGMTTLAILCTLGVFIIVLLATKFVSLSSMVAAFSYPLFLIIVFHESTEQVVFGLIIAIALLVTHRKNIRRLIKGEESKTYLLEKWKKKE